MTCVQSKQSGAMRASRLAILLLASAGIPVVAQVNWTSSSGLAEQGIVGATGDGSPNIVCRGESGGVIYPGQTVPGGCEVLAGSPGTSLTRVLLTNYEVAVGLSLWSRTPVPGAAPVTASSVGVVGLRPCETENFLGYVRTDETVCRGALKGNPESSSNYALLYPLDLSAPLQARILTNERLCLTPRGTSVLAEPCGFANDPLQAASITPVETGVYQLRILGGCLSIQPSLAVLRACTDPSTRLWIADQTGKGQFRIRNENGSFYLQATNILVNSAPVNNSAAQQFALRTVADAARHMRVISYNAMLLLQTVFPAMRQEDRARWIVGQIMGEDPGYDVIAIQEAFDNGQPAALFLNSSYEELKDAMAEAGYLFHTGRPTTLNLDNGGVVIFSRWPIEVWDNNIFDFSKCADADCFSAKGINYAKVNKMGRRYHFFNTHLQSGFGRWSFRRRQLEEFRPWIDGLVGTRTDEPVIVTGDFNIDMEEQPDNYQEMLTLIGAEFFNAPRPPGVPVNPPLFRWTVDPDVNEITRERGGSQEWLDYILTARPGPAPESASYLVKQYKRSEDYRIDTFANIFRTTDLSDHGALLASLVFPYGTLVPIGPTTVQVTFRADSNPAAPADAIVEVNGDRFRMPVTLNLEKTVTHQVRLIAPEPTTNTRWVFDGWKFPVGGTNAAVDSFQLERPTVDSTYIALFETQYLLTVTPNPANGGTVTGGGWYKFRSRADITATAAPGFRFTGFSGDSVRTVSPDRIDIERPSTVVANFVSTLVPITFQASSANGTPTGAAVVVNGTSYPMPATLQLDPLQTYTVQTSPIDGATDRWLFQGWAHTQANPWTLTKPAAAQTYTARFERQFLLTLTASPTAGGSLTGAGWYAAGASASLSATPNAGYRFSGFSGDFVSTAATGSVVMSRARSVVGNFGSAGQPTLFVQSGARVDQGPGGRLVPLQVRNTSTNAAVNVRITSISAITVTGGTGAVLPPRVLLPIELGNIAPGASATSNLVFSWPATATRIRMTVSFSADGGYTGSTTLNLVR